MSEWKEVGLGELCDVRDGTHDSPKEVTHGKKLITSRHIKGGKIDFGTAYEISFEDYEFVNRRSKVDQFDVLFSMIGTIAETVVVDFKPDFAIKNVGLFKTGGDENLAKWVYYYLKSTEAKAEIYASLKGSTQQYITLGDLRKFPIKFPDESVRSKIIEVLSSLDDKIDLLHRQNQTLEHMAETLFRQWFVEEADDNWEVLQLQDIAEVKNGFAFSSKSYVDYSPEHLEVLKMGHIEKGGGLRTNPKRDYAPREERLERYILDKGDIVMAMTDMKDNVVILGVPAIIDESGRYVLNQRVARISLKNRDSLINEYLLYVQLKDPDFIAELQSKANSGVQVNLSTASIKESEILILPMELQLEKGNSITDLYLKKEYNDKQIKSLTKLRDTLLPKLMSGEIRLFENG